MSEAIKAAKIENLELNRETVQDLTEDEGAQVMGGILGSSHNPNACARAGLSDNPKACVRAGLTNDPKACA